MARKPKEKPSEASFDDTATTTLKPGQNKASFRYTALWKQEVTAYEQFTNRWMEKGNKVIKRYRDERAKLDESRRRYNVLWANINVMKPAIYSKCPDPIVERKFLDKDPIARLSATILERTTIAQLEHGFHTSINRAVYDRLLPGRGQVWVRYEPVFERDQEAVSIPTQNGSTLEDSLIKIAKDVGDKDLIEETGAEEELEETGDTLAAEKICVDYIDWRDFYIFPAKARTWAEVQAVGKRVYMSKQECIERFGKDIGEQMRPDTTPEDSKSIRNQSDTTLFQDINERAIVVFEIWNKSDQRVYWISTGYEYLCDVRSDPYKLRKFFPCPEPLSATITSDNLNPIPDYYEYQDQAIQIDELTQRIALLTKACKVAGAYNAANKALSRILEETMDNQLIPVDQWAMFAERGGVKGAIDLLPLDDIKSCIETLTKIREQCKIDLDQITGVSDVIRGTTDSRETLGGLRLKNNNAGTRLSESQEAVARFCRETISIMAELIAKHFTDETLIECSGIMYEEELQPETVMLEWQAMHGLAPVTPTLGQPQQQQQQPQGQQQPQQPMLPPPQQPQAPQQNNVVPFPGGQQQQPMPPMMPPMPDPEVLIMQKIMPAIQLLRDDIHRNYRIDIETDSTIFGDKMQDKQDATEFVTAFGNFMKGFESMAQTVPESMPLLAKTLQWATRKYRVGRDLESSINTFCDQMLKKAKLMAQNPQQSPEQQKAQAEIQREAMRAQMQMQNDQREAERQAQDDARQAELQRTNDERQARMQEASDQRKAQLEQMHFEMEQVKMRHEMAMAEKEHSFKLAEHETKMREMKEKHEEAAKVRKDRANKPKKTASAK